MREVSLEAQLRMERYRESDGLGRDDFKVDFDGRRFGMVCATIGLISSGIIYYLANY